MSDFGAAMSDVGKDAGEGEVETILKSTEAGATVLTRLSTCLRDLRNKSHMVKKIPTKIPQKVPHFSPAK